MPTLAITFEERLLSRYEVMKVGYGQISRHGQNQPAHRAMWEHHHGPIEGKLTIDHLCLNRQCCIKSRHTPWLPTSRTALARFSPH